MKVWIFLCVLQPKQHNRWNIEAHVRIQLPSIKLDIQESCKNATSVTRFFCLEGANVVNFHENIFSISTFKAYSIYIVYFYIYFLRFSLYIYSMLFFIF